MSKQKYQKAKKEIFISSIQKFRDSGQPSRHYLADYLENFIEFSDWFYLLSDEDPSKTPIAMRVCLENFIEINYLLSQIFVDSAHPKRDLNKIILGRSLKTYKKFYDLISAGVFGDKTTNFKNNAEILKIVEEGYKKSAQVAKSEGYSFEEDIKKVKASNLDDPLLFKTENANLHNFEYWWNAYSFLCEFAHPNSDIKSLVPSKDRFRICLIWHEKMIDILSETLTKSEL